MCYGLKRTSSSIEYTVLEKLHPGKHDPSWQNFTITLTENSSEKPQSTTTKI
ncbi:hypothetical protein DPMN_163288 [Dreissena polymorpha]|uniref:Uncharacterized protein n=1 Tax=Dreissena polymorpha TaxID=45954 RepID=A0A9D4ETN5_DREPO|nr:hypothetical protein DPMN_163288 [Dreissena polymorpha]